MPYVSCTKLDTALAEKQDQLQNSSGGDLAADTCVLSCAEVNAIVADIGNIVGGTNVSVTGSGTAASPYLISVPSASETTSGAVELATVAEALAGIDSVRAVTPAGLAAALAGIAGQSALTGLDGNALPGGSCVMTCAEVTAAIEAETDKITLVASGTGYTFTNGDNVSTSISASQFISTDVGNSIGTGTDGGLKLLVPAQLPDDQVLTGDNSGNVSLTLTPVVDPGTGNTNYTILANLKTAATNPSGGTNLLVAGASGWYVALRNCAGNYHAQDAQVPSCTEMNTAITTAVPSGGTDGQVLTKQADGTNAWETVAAGSTFSLVDCNGASIASGGAVATCVNLNARIPTGGSSGQVLTKQADGSNAWSTPTAIPTYTDCNGSAISSGATLATCANLDARVPVGGTDGQVLTKQADGSNAWETVSSSGLRTQVEHVRGDYTTLSVPSNGTWLQSPGTYEGFPVQVSPSSDFFGEIVNSSGPTGQYRVYMPTTGSNEYLRAIRGDNGVWYGIANLSTVNYTMPVGVKPVQVLWGIN